MTTQLCLLSDDRVERERVMTEWRGASGERERVEREEETPNTSTLFLEEHS